MITKDKYMWPWTTKPHIFLFILETEIYTSYGNWIHKLSIDVWFVMIGQNLAEIFEYRYSEGAKKNHNIKKIAFKSK